MFLVLSRLITIKSALSRTYFIIEGMYGNTSVSLNYSALLKYDDSDKYGTMSYQIILFSS